MDLKDGCEQEPVHVPGSIQPHGVLLVLDPESEVVLQAAGPVEALLGTQDGMHGRSLRKVLGRSLAALREESGAVLGRVPTYVGTARGPGGIGLLTLTGHLVNGAAVLELEPAAEPRIAATLLAIIRSATERIGDAASLLDAANIAADEVRAITGYDRVMVYQFLSDGSGSVIAEVKAVGQLPFLDHRFPASDIPAQARELYRHSPIRVIADVAYVPSPLLPVASASDGPLDMSHCALRSVSPVHIKYLDNMGVGASMSVSLLLRGELWGLIACHNQAPLPVPYEARELCKHVAQVLSHKIQALGEADGHRLTQDFGAAAERLLGDLLKVDKPDAALIDRCSALLGIVGSSGAAISWKGAVSTAGRVPPASELGPLAEGLRARLASGDMLISNKLAEEFPRAAHFESEGSGLLSLLLQGEDPPLLMWFRAEQVQEISWAGNPSEPLDPSSRLGALNPRESFATWKETVRGRCTPWRAVEIESARSFGRRLATVLQQQQVRELNVLLRRANDELATLATTDPLTGVANRRAFDDRLDYEWARARRHSASLAIIILDLDFFKQFNDHFGHPDGDACLRKIGRILGDSRRSTDLPARIGGEEFSVLLADTDMDGAVRVAEKIRSGIQALKLSHPKSPFRVMTASFGLAVQIPDSSSVARDLVKAADSALYSAKAAGRNRIVSA